MAVTLGDSVGGIPPRVGTPAHIAPGNAIVPPGIGDSRSSFSSAAAPAARPAPRTSYCMGRIKSYFSRIMGSIKKCWEGVKAWFFGTLDNAPTGGVVVSALKTHLEAFLAMINDRQISEAALEASFSQIGEGREVLYSALGGTQEATLDFRSNEVKGALKYLIMSCSFGEILAETTHEGRRSKFGSLSAQNQGIVNVLIGLNLPADHEDRPLEPVIADLVEHSMLDPIVEKSIKDASSPRLQTCIREFLSFERGEGYEVHLIDGLRAGLAPGELDVD